MRKKYLLYVCLLSLVMASCHNEEMWDHQSSAKPESVEFTDVELAALFQMRGQSHKVDMSEATQFANDVIGFLDGSTSTRAASPRKVSSVTALTGERMATRTTSGETVQMPDTLAYLFNFSDSTGYAIISADKRIDASILSYCSAGNLGGKTDNPGLIGALMDMENYIVASITHYENQIDSITNEILMKIIAEDSTATRATMPQNQSNLLQQYEVTTVKFEPGVSMYPGTYTDQATYVGNWVTATQIEPLLPVEWKQKFPFNYYVKKKNESTNAPAGCVAVAIAHIMVYWKYPANIYGIDWPLLESYTTGKSNYTNVKDKIKFYYDEDDYKDPYINKNMKSEEKKFIIHAATLMEKIGTGVKMEYKDTGSGAKTSDAISFLKANGYNVNEGDIDYTFGRVIQSLNNGKPVYATGFTKKIRNSFIGIDFIARDNYEEGHAWIIDGYIKQSKATTLLVRVSSRYTGEVLSESTTTTYNHAYYFHHNWGWGSSDNGYFVEGSYDSQNRETKFDSRTLKNYDPYNFQYEKKIIPNISPR